MAPEAHWALPCCCSAERTSRCDTRNASIQSWWHFWLIRSAIVTGLLDGGFMRLAQVHVDAVAGAASLSDQRRPATCCDGDANAGGVGDAPAGLLVPAYGALGLGNTADGDGLALPAVEAKDPVCLRDDLPAFQVCHLPRPCSRCRTLARSRGAARAASCSGEKPLGCAG